MAEAIRLNKYLADAGVCSRREADRLIEEGKVLVDGVVAAMGTKVEPGQEVICEGKKVGEKEESVFLIVNKPKGIVCTTSDKDHAPNIVDFINYPKRVYPVGRLDKDSEGLLLMTNEGDIVNKILRGGNDHEKEYAVAVNKPVTEEFLKQLLYLCALMNEFERRHRARQKANRKDKEMNKIIEKYTKEIKEISENPEYSQEYKNEEIKKIRATMEKEIKALDLELTR